MTRIATKRLVLSPFHAADADEFYRICNQKHVIERMPDWEMTRAGVRAMIASFSFGARMDDPRRQAVALALRREDGGKPIGFLGVGPRYELDYEVEVGYFLDERALGNGYATEAVRAVAGHAFSAWGLGALRAVVAPENTASAAVLLRSSFRYEKEISFRLSGEREKKAYDVYFRLADGAPPASGRREESKGENMP